MGVCDSNDHIYIEVPDGEDWDFFEEEEKASADLKELLVSSADCFRYCRDRNQSSD